MVKEMLERMKNNPEIRESTLGSESFEASLMNFMIPDYRKCRLDTLMEDISEIRVNSDPFDEDSDDCFSCRFRFHFHGEDYVMFVLVQFDENVLTVGRKDEAVDDVLEMFHYEWKRDIYVRNIVAFRKIILRG